MDKLKDVECFLLDMDGVVYLGQQIISGARGFINTLKEQNKDFYFLTNNSSKSARIYQEKLRGFGITVREDKIVSSGEVTADYIVKQKHAPTIYLVGTPSLRAEMEAAGIRVVAEKDEEIDYLVLGFDTTLSYKKIWDAHDLLLEGIPYIATNPDHVCPLEDGMSMPDCGSIISLLKTSTGREPLVIGKPGTMMIDYLVEKTSLRKQGMAFIGDRLYTDIQTALNGGIISILVLSGETKLADLKGAPQRPDYVFPSIRELKELLEK